jgi:Fe2+ or Zn2+ uptake regulation protein
VLQLLRARGLLKELPIDGAATVYDSNTRRTTTCTTSTPAAEVADLPMAQLQVLGLPESLGGAQLVDVDVIVRVRGLTWQVGAGSGRSVEAGPDLHLG